MEGPGRFVREGVYACSDAGCLPLETVHIGDDSATAPNFRGDVDETREILGLGQSRPPEVLDHAEQWERVLVAAASWVSLSEGCDGGVLIWCVGFESALIRLYGLAGKVYAGGVREGRGGPGGRYGPGEHYDAVLRGVA